jgi:hypothetical protein
MLKKTAMVAIVIAAVVTWQQSTTPEPECYKAFHKVYKDKEIGFTIGQTGSFRYTTGVPEGPKGVRKGPQIDCSYLEVPSNNLLLVSNNGMRRIFYTKKQGLGPVFLKAYCCRKSFKSLLATEFPLTRAQRSLHKP